LSYAVHKRQTAVKTVNLLKVAEVKVFHDVELLHLLETFCLSIIRRWSTLGPALAAMLHELYSESAWITQQRQYMHYSVVLQVICVTAWEHPPYPLQDFKALYKCCIIIIIIANPHRCCWQRYCVLSYSLSYSVQT